MGHARIARGFRRCETRVHGSVLILLIRTHGSVLIILILLLSKQLRMAIYGIFELVFLS